MVKGDHITKCPRIYDIHKISPIQAMHRIQNSKKWINNVCLSSCVHSIINYYPLPPSGRLLQSLVKLMISLAITICLTFIFSNSLSCDDILACMDLYWNCSESFWETIVLFSTWSLASLDCSPMFCSCTTSTLECNVVFSDLNTLAWPVTLSSCVFRLVFSASNVAFCDQITWTLGNFIWQSTEDIKSNNRSHPCAEYSREEIFSEQVP